MKGKLYLASKRGFCSGVKRAVELVSETVKHGPFPVRVLHEIVHNESIVNAFTGEGVKFFEEPDPGWNDGSLILSAHGVGAALEEKVKSMHLNVIDATCPLVKRLHATAINLERDGYFILMAGKRNHRETEGVVGRLRKAPVIFETPEEAVLFQPEPGYSYAIISQTTLSVDEYEAILSVLRRKIPDLKISGGICQATTSRQLAVKQLTGKCRRIIVIGSTKSSNSKRLQEVASNAGADAILIPDANALPESYFDIPGDIGITSGASAPEYLVEELVSRLQKHGWELAGS